MSELEARSSAIGEELALLHGVRSTRLKARLNTTAHVGYGVENATSTDGGVLFVLSAGKWPVAAAAGQRFRVQIPGVSDSAFGTVIARVDDTTLQVLPPLGGEWPATMTGVSWELFTAAAQATATVETTHDWPDAGIFVMDGEVFRYASKGLNSLATLEHYNGEMWVYAVPRMFERLTELVDYSRIYSAVDRTRRALLIEYAEGEDLDILGLLNGIRRPTGLSDDEVFRRILKAVSWAPRGTMWCVELLLEAALGPNNYEIFEDFTSGPSSGDRGDMGAAHYPGQIFIRGTQDPERFAGRTYVEHHERRPLTTGTTLSTTLPAIQVGSVRIAPEGFERVVLSGDALGVVGAYDAATDSYVVTGPAGSFPSGVPLLGDDFHLLTGSRGGRLGVVSEYIDDTRIRVGPLQSAPNSPTSRMSFGALAWKITREKTSAIYHLPSADRHVEYTGGPRRQQWAFVGTNGATEAPINVTLSAGSATALANLATQTVFYRQLARVLPYSRASFEALARFQPFIASAIADQQGMRMSDGQKMLAVGVVRSGPNHIVGFVSGSALIASGASLTNATWHTYEIRKHDDLRGRVVEFLVDGNVRQRLAYGAFANDAGAPRREIGIFEGTNTTSMAIRHLDWSAETPRDFWNIHVPSGSKPATMRLIDSAATGPFAGAVAGTRVRVKEYTAALFPSGNIRGEWEVASVISPNEVTIIGPRRIGTGLCRQHERDVFVTENDPQGFRWPDDLGRAVEILTGPAAGETRLIIDLLDPVDRTSIEDRWPSYPLTELHPPQDWTSVAVLDAEFSVAFEDADWRFATAGLASADAGPFELEVVDQGTHVGTALALPRALPIAPPSPAALVEVGYSTVLTGQTIREAQVNDTRASPPPEYAFYPFYLADDTSWLQELLDVITAAGVHVNLHRLVRDDAGLHIV